MICITCHIVHISTIMHRKVWRNEESQSNCIEVVGWSRSVSSVIVYFTVFSVYMKRNLKHFWRLNCTDWHRDLACALSVCLSTPSHSSRCTRLRCRSHCKRAISIRDSSLCIETFSHIIHVVQWISFSLRKKLPVYFILSRKLYLCLRIIFFMLLKLRSNCTSREHDL